jgi:uncharacterized protein YaiI (UPF0178 family)
VCPAVVKDIILYRAAQRWQISLTLFANKPLRTPTSRFIRTLQVLRGFGVAGTKSSSACRRTILSSQATYRLLAT